MRQRFGRFNICARCARARLHAAELAASAPTYGGEGPCREFAPLSYPAPFREIPPTDFGLTHGAEALPYVPSPFVGRSNRQLRCNRCRVAPSKAASASGCCRRGCVSGAARVYQPRWPRISVGASRRAGTRAGAASRPSCTGRSIADAVVGRVRGAAGGVRCARGAACKWAENGLGGFILPGQSWDLDHADAALPGLYIGASHSSCNRAAPSLRRRSRQVMSKMCGSTCSDDRPGVASDRGQPPRAGGRPRREPRIPDCVLRRATPAETSVGRSDDTEPERAFSLRARLITLGARALARGMERRPGQRHRPTIEPRRPPSTDGNG